MKRAIKCPYLSVLSTPSSLRVRDRSASDWFDWVRRFLENRRRDLSAHSPHWWIWCPHFELHFRFVVFPTFGFWVCYVAAVVICEFTWSWHPHLITTSFSLLISPLQLTSGTTGSPKGVVMHSRGAYLNSVGNQVEWNMEKFARFLWCEYCVFQYVFFLTILLF